MRERPGSKKVVLAMLVLSIAVLLSACNGGSDTDDSAPANTEVSTTGPKSKPPPLVQTGEDFNAITRSLIAYNDWLIVNPDPALTDKIFDPSSRMFSESKSALTNMKTKEWHYDAKGSTQVLTVNLTKRVAADSVVIHTLLKSPSRQVLDKNNKHVSTTPSFQRKAVIYSLVNRDGIWRIQNVADAGDV